MYVYIYHIERKGPVVHGRSAKTVMYISYWEEGTRIARAECEDGAISIILGGRDPYCTGGVRRRCYDIHIFVSLQIIENKWLCVMYMCVWVCDTKGMLDVLLYMVLETPDTGHVCIYQQ